MTRRDDLQKLIKLNTRYLQKLKEQQSIKGIDTEPRLLIEIEDKTAELEQLKAELAALEEEPPTGSGSALERQTGLSLWQIGLIGVFGLGLVCVVSLVVTTGSIINQFNAATSTPPVALLPTPTPPPLLGTPTPTSRPLPLTITPNPACPHSGTQIFQPNTGTPVIGVVQVIGVAFIDDFDYYKFEHRPLKTVEWNFINRFDGPVVAANVLGTWNTTTVAPGEYEFRLVVVDRMGNFGEPCVVQLSVQ